MLLNAQEWVSEVVCSINQDFENVWVGFTGSSCRTATVKSLCDKKVVAGVMFVLIGDRSDALAVISAVKNGVGEDRACMLGQHACHGVTRLTHAQAGCFRCHVIEFRHVHSRSFLAVQMTGPLLYAQYIFFHICQVRVSRL